MLKRMKSDSTTGVWERGGSGWQRGREFILKMCQKRSIKHKNVDVIGGFHPTWHAAQLLRRDGSLRKHSDARYESF